MGTWSHGPFESDTAEDIIDEFRAMPSSRRADEIAVRTGRLCTAREIEQANMEPELYALIGIIAVNFCSDDIVSKVDLENLATGLLSNSSRSELKLLGARAGRALLQVDRFWDSWTDPTEGDKGRSMLKSIVECLQRQDTRN
ncbi:DUF4259 domain-containing protein [Glycomyces tarimensis]